MILKHRLSLPCSLAVSMDTPYEGTNNFVGLQINQNIPRYPHKDEMTYKYVCHTQHIQVAVNCY
jgi:hypothetical protein